MRPEPWNWRVTQAHITVDDDAVERLVDIFQDLLNAWQLTSEELPRNIFFHLWYINGDLSGSSGTLPTLKE